MSKRHTGTAKKESKQKNTELINDDSFYTPLIRETMGEYRFGIFAVLDTIESQYIIKDLIQQYRKSQGQSYNVTDKYVYTTIKILRQFSKNINFNGKGDVRVPAYEQINEKEYNPYLKYLAEQIGLSLTTVKGHVRAIIGAGIMQFEKVEGKRHKIKRFTLEFLQAIDMNEWYQQIVVIAQETREKLENAYNKRLEVRQKKVDKARKLLEFYTNPRRDDKQPDPFNPLLPHQQFNSDPLF